jgi:hypothetical protein
MNLECKEVNLWQTPTFITYMCFSNNDGGWRGILYRYKMWVQYETQLALNCNCKNAAEQKNSQARVREHLDELDKAIKCHKKLTFTII